MGKQKKPHVCHNTGQFEWYTPPEYVDAARAVMGGIDCDPASSDVANEIVGADTYFTIDDDGLTQDWEGRVWMNPPYSRSLIKPFCLKLVDQYGDSVTEACVMVNSATDTRWFHILLDDAAAVCLIKGRVSCLHEEGNPRRKPLQGQVVLYFGEKVDKFVSEFSQFGNIVLMRSQRQPGTIFRQAPTSASSSTENQWVRLAEASRGDHRNHNNWSTGPTPSE